MRPVSQSASSLSGSSSSASSAASSDSVQRVYVPLHEATEQDVVLVRPAMGGAIQQAAAPRIEGGWFWFTHRRGVI